MSAGRGSGEHAAFFQSLPPNDLLPMEASLRQLLLEWLHRKPGAFPLIEWIDRRVGGEIETRPDSRGVYEISLRGRPGPPAAGAPAMGAPYGHAAAGPPVRSSMPPAPGAPPPAPPSAPPPGSLGRKDALGKEAFFKSMPDGRFSPEEVTLREAVFEFLATWKSQELATLVDLCNFAPVERSRAALLPNDLSVKEWLERRIGGEVELKPGKSGRDLIVCLTAEGKRLVREKFEQISTGGVQATPEPSSKDAYFSTLPQDELLPDELKLREEVVNFLRKWRRDKPQSLPSIGDLSNDGQIGKIRAKLLPNKVKLRSWIERRIGGEIELKKSASGGDHQVMFREGQAPPDMPPAAEPEKARKSTPAQVFFDTLPEDELLDTEQELREALLDYLQDPHRKGNGGVAPEVADVSRAFQKEPALSQKKVALLPPEVSLQMWINRRVGGEVEIYKDHRGRQVIRLRDEATTGGEPVDAQDEGRFEQTAVDEQAERFFASLPGDEFSTAEETLRTSLLAFLQKWRQPGLPSVMQLQGDRDVARHAVAVLPRGCGASLPQWILRRIGGEIEVVGTGDEMKRKVRLVVEAPAVPEDDRSAKRQRR